MGRRGGIASGKAKQARRAMRETIEILLQMPIGKGAAADVEAIRNFAALRGKNITVQDAVLVAQVQKAMKGDARAAEFVRDTIGEAPVTRVDADVKNIVPVIGGESELMD